MGCPITSPPPSPGFLAGSCCALVPVLPSAPGTLSGHFLHSPRGLLKCCLPGVSRLRSAQDAFLVAEMGGGLNITVGRGCVGDVTALSILHSVPR